MDAREYYLKLADDRSKFMGKAISDKQTFEKYCVAHNYIKDYHKLLSVISGPEREIFRHACREYQYALEAAITGKFRHSLSSLRLSLELFLGALYFSAHQLKMKLWIKGEEDLRWAVLLDVDNGLFSATFLAAFFPELRTYRDKYRNIATKVYRECSEYVHGNSGTHSDNEMAFDYDPSLILQFCDKAETVRDCVVYVFLVKYLLDMDSESRNSIEIMVLDLFGDYPEVREIFGVTK